MSASSKKKLRKEQNAALQTVKQKAAQKEAKKLKIYTLTFWVKRVSAGGEPDYYYFLKGSSGMPSHLIPPQRWAEEIGDYCTVSPEDYAGPESTTVIGSGFCGDNITYTVTKNGTMTVSGTGVAQMPYGSGLERIRNVVFEEGITAIEPNAFYFNSICGVTLPESLTTIGDRAFSGCALTQLHIPAGVTQIGTEALGGRSFQRITVDPANTAYTSINGSLYTKDGKTLLRYAGMMTDDGALIEECTLPDGVAVIAPYAFGGNSQLKHVVLPNTVTHIEQLCAGGPAGEPDLPWRLRL